MKERDVIEALYDYPLHLRDCCRMPCHPKAKLCCPPVLFDKIQFTVNKPTLCDRQSTDRCSVRESPTHPRGSPLRLDPQASPVGASRLPLHPAQFTAHFHSSSSVTPHIAFLQTRRPRYTHLAPRRQDVHAEYYSCCFYVIGVFCPTLDSRNSTGGPCSARARVDSSSGPEHKECGSGMHHVEPVECGEFIVV